MKKYAIISIVAVAVVILAAGSLLAKTAKPNHDMAGSKQMVFKTCEGRGVKFIGVAYNDLKHRDAMDAVSVICKSKKKGEYMVPNHDFTDRAIKKIKCNYDEYVWGIAYKDREGKDAADGVTVICKDRTGATRVAYNDDLLGGRKYVQITGKNAIGIAYNDRINNDEVDGVTLVVK
jgi:hypothetical protein